METELKYWIWLASLGVFRPAAAAALLARFHSPADIYSAGINALGETAGITPADIKYLMNKDLDPADRIIEECRRHGFNVLTLADSGYPDRLRNIYDPPTVLYVRGKLPVFDDIPAVAIAGTRKSTPYGETAAGGIAYKLARSGICVVTGLARGIDSAATRGALRAGKTEGSGRAVGVIGSGLDVIYPPENKQLFDEVAREGAIISEYPPGTPPKPANFPARNRILSGLSLGVAIIEAPVRSGALITAARALEQNRDVFTLPGNIDARNNEGSNALLREGAIPLLSGDDIISEYAELFPDIIITGASDADSASSGRHDTQALKKEVDNEPLMDYIDPDAIISALEGDEHAVAKALGADTLHCDEVIAASGLPAPRALSALTMLEINGCAARDMNGRWKLKAGRPFSQ